jgi:hypothetical protein
MGIFEGFYRFSHYSLSFYRDQFGLSCAEAQLGFDLPHFPVARFSVRGIEDRLHIAALPAPFPIAQFEVNEPRGIFDRDFHEILFSEVQKARVIPRP